MGLFWCPWLLQVPCSTTAASCALCAYTCRRDKICADLALYQTTHRNEYSREKNNLKKKQRLYSFFLLRTKLKTLTLFQLKRVRHKREKTAPCCSRPAANPTCVSLCWQRCPRAEGLCWRLLALLLVSPSCHPVSPHAELRGFWFIWQNAPCDCRGGRRKSLRTHRPQPAPGGGPTDPYPQKYFHTSISVNRIPCVSKGLWGLAFTHLIFPVCKIYFLSASLENFTIFVLLFCQDFPIYPDFPITSNTI